MYSDRQIVFLIYMIFLCFLLLFILVFLIIRLVVGMKTIKECSINEIVINKSRFISVLEYVENKDDVLKVIDKYKKIYPSATHYCFAYIFKNTEKCSDDKEPSGTAGMPILNVLKANNLTNVICLVIRYFGGIKLGAGGLVRAYSRCTSEVLKKSVICSLVNGFTITVRFDYDYINVFDSMPITVLNKCFTDKVIYIFNISSDNYFSKKDFLDKFIIDKKEVLIKE